MILIASDHAGVEVKAAVIGFLRERGEAVEDLGTASTASVDYPDFAHALARRLVAADTRGILICGTGIGMSMTANRHRGVRAAVCQDAFTAAMARRHNDANVLCLGARVLGQGVVEQVVDVFLSTPFDGGRHQRRVTKIELEEP